MIISGIPSFALSFVNSFPWFQVATNVMILVLSSEYTTMGPNTFEIEYFVHVQFNKLKLSKNLWIEISVSLNNIIIWFCIYSCTDMSIVLLTYIEDVSIEVDI